VIQFNYFFGVNKIFRQLPYDYSIITFPSFLSGCGKKHKTPQFILAKRGALLDAIAMGMAPDL